MTLIENAKILIGKRFRRGAVLFSEKIERLFFPTVGGAELPKDVTRVDAKGGYLIPGLIDAHTHGAMGEDFSDGRTEGFSTLSSYYARGGVTGFLATTMTLPKDRLLSACRAVKEFRGTGAKCLGLHLEGPFLSEHKRGAQAKEFLQTPDLRLFETLCEASGDRVKLLTVAPELDGAMALIKEASKSCTVSIGHTEADYETAKRAFEAGARRVTHLFNAMPPFLHRAPAVLGAAFDCGADVEIISDGLHLHPSTVRMAFALFGDKLNLISDSMRSAGLSDGVYELGGQEVFVKGGKATLKDGTLAGSSVHLMDAVRRAVSFGIRKEDAFFAASAAPCRSLGIEGRGKIEEGYFADLVLLGEELDVKSVYLCGKKFEEK